MSDLTCVKEIFDSLSSEKKTELFKHFVTTLNDSAKGVNRPTTSVTNTESSDLSTLKRPLNSPVSPLRRKKDSKVFCYSSYLINV